MPRQLLCSIAVSIVVFLAAAESYAKLTSDEVEILTVKGQIEVNAGRLDSAKGIFKQLQADNPKSVIAAEQLAHIAELEGDFEDAIRIYSESKKFQPRSRLGNINFYIGDLYIKLGHPRVAREYFLAALRQGSDPAATNYYLGYTLYLLGRLREAEGTFFNAWVLMKQKKKPLTKSDELVWQRLNYYLGELYASLGFPRYSNSHLNVSEKGTEASVSSMSKQLKEMLDRTVVRGSLGFLLQYDSNALALPRQMASPWGTRTRKGFANILLANITAQTGSASRFGAGGEYTFYLSRHPREDLGGVDTLTNMAGVWASWWNRNDMEVRTRYDFNYTLIDRHAFRHYITTHSPQLAWSYFPDHRHLAEATYTYRINEFPDDPENAVDDRRSGNDHVVTLKGSFAAPNPHYQPFAQYTFTASDTSGRNFDSLSHMLELGSSYWLSDFTKATASAAYGISNFPDYNALVKRADKIIQFHFNLTTPVTNSLLALVEIYHTKNFSNVSDVYTYKRFTFSVGAVYNLPF